MNDRGSTYGNFLTDTDAADGRNFLTPDIHRYATERIAAGGGVEEFRCTRNLLSSQPMAFNLFGPLHDDPDLARLLLDPLLPGGVETASVDVEWAPPHVSNGPTEAINNLVKRVKHTAFGMTNFRNYRIRSLLYAGKPDWSLLDAIPH